MDKKREISELVISGNKTQMVEEIKEACDRGENPIEILEQGLLPGMEVVGERFKNNQMFIPEVLASASAMHAALDILKPLLVSERAQPTGKVVIGTVFGDVHDIGKNIVSMMLQAGRFEVIDLGVNVPIEKFVEQVRAERPDILALSALLSTTIPMFRKTINAVNSAGLHVKTMVGGTQVNSAYAKESGADGYGPNAVIAVDVAKKLVAQKHQEERLVK